LTRGNALSIREDITVARISAFIGALAVAIALIIAPTAASAGVFVGAGIGIGVGVSIDIAPPPLPVYVQPPVVVADEIWTPGYWAYGAYGYYWVPGTWVAAPQPGFLWTPGYWAYNGGHYGWHAGYWGPHVGFYGGVNYGFGYTGVGYAGGGWVGRHFNYNAAVTNVNRTVITNVYVDRTVVNNDSDTAVRRVSFNGGPDGIQARPTAEEAAYRSEPHVAATAEQQGHIAVAAQNRNFLASVNDGHPANAAFAAPLSRENLPANFAPVAPADRDAAPGRDGSSAFSRFDHDRGANAPASNAYRSPDNAYRSPDNAYRSPDTIDRPANTYRPVNADHPASAPHPASAYHAPHAPAEREHAPPAHEHEHER
jgi:hypothetical protein